MTSNEYFKTSESIHNVTERLNKTIERLQKAENTKNNKIRIKCVSCDLKNVKRECEELLLC